MGQEGWNPSAFGIENHGIRNARNVYWNLPPEALYEHAVKRGEAVISQDGPLVASTGKYTGRSPNDKFVVREPSSEANVWWGAVNRAVEIDQFDRLHRRVLGYLQGRDLFVQDLSAGADPAYRKPIRVISEYAWHSLFVRNMFIRTDP